MPFKRGLEPIRARFFECLPLIVVLSSLCTQVHAFPGQTAAEMIGVLGKPDNDYDKPPIPAIEQFSKGPVRLNAVYWRGTEYDPMRGKGTLPGVLVVSFDYNSKDIDQRLSQAPPNVGWEHLVSYTEVFLTYMPAEEFDKYLAGLKPDWRIDVVKDVEDVEVPYRLYDLTSCDGRFRAEFSYAEKGGVGMITMPDNSKRQSHNLWTRVTRVDQDLQ